MDPQAHLSAISLFYYLAFLDDRVGLFATLKTWEKIKTTFAIKQKSSSEWAQSFVSATNEGFLRHQKLNPNQVSLPQHMKLTTSQGVDLGPWREFRKRVGHDEFLSVLWTKVLEIPEDDVAKALRISNGTLRHRLSRGLRKLGESGLGAWL